MKNRKIVFTIMLVMLIVSNSMEVQAEDAGAISWLKSIDSAKAAALKENKIIMVDVFTDWCHWCKELDAKVFTDAKVIDSSRKLISLKVNAEDGGPGQMFARKYGVNSYPTILFINGQGQEVDRIGGFLPAEDFASEMERIISGRDTFLSLEQGFQKGNLSMQQACTLANRYLEQSMSEKAGEVLKTVDITASNDEDEIENVLMTKFNYNFVTRKYDEAEKLLSFYIGKYSHREMYPNSLYYMAVTKAVMGKKEDAGTYLAELKSKFADKKEMIARAEQLISRY